MQTLNQLPPACKLNILRSEFRGTECTYVAATNYTVVFAYPGIRYLDIRIYPLILCIQKSGYLKVKIRLLRLFAKIV